MWLIAHLLERTREHSQFVFHKKLLQNFPLVPRRISLLLCLPPDFKLMSCSVYSPTLKMEVICSSEMSVDFHWTTRPCIPEDRTLLPCYCPIIMIFHFRPLSSINMTSRNERHIISLWKSKFETVVCLRDIPEFGISSRGPAPDKGRCQLGYARGPPNHTYRPDRHFPARLNANRLLHQNEVSLARVNYK
jgi:hypothetical protein